MTTVKYTRWLRSYVGHQRILQVRVGAFACNEEGRLLLCKRADVMLWDIPGGTIELDETPAQGLRREMLSETGLHLVADRLIGIYSGPDFAWTYPNGDQAQLMNLFFFARIVGGDLQPSSPDNVSVEFFSLDALPPLLPRATRMLNDALKNKPEAYFD
jgi:ADP-ribose pyrophosphatase YjhB (NUDIX family)